MKKNKKDDEYIKKSLERKAINQRLPSTITDNDIVYYKNGIINNYHIYTSEEDKQIIFTIGEMIGGNNHNFNSKCEMIEWLSTYNVNFKLKEQNPKKDMKVIDIYEIEDDVIYHEEGIDKDTMYYWDDNEFIRRGDNNLLTTKEGYKKYLLLKEKI